MLEQSIDVFIGLVQDHRFLGYGILFLAMVIEGEMFLIIAGMLARLGAFDFGDVLWISFAGVMVGDVFWYALGMFFSRRGRVSRFSLAAEKSVSYLLPEFRKKPFRSIFLSKFIYGANHATLVLSGVLRVKFSLFLKAELVASFVWVAIFSVVGFMFGQVALSVTNKISQFALAALVFVVMFILIQRYVGKNYTKKQNEENENNNS